MTVDSLTYIYNEKEIPLICMYRKYNSYPSIHGRAIFDFLFLRRVVDNRDEIEYRTNIGMGCLAATFVKEFKMGILDITMFPTNITQTNEAFSYHIYRDRIVVKNYQGYVAFIGEWDQFRFFCEPDE